MTHTQQLITLLVILLGTVFTRFAPYIAFPEGRPIPRYIGFLGRFLAPAVFGMLVVYCLRNVDLMTSFSEGGTHGIPELIGVALTAVTFTWKRNMMLSMAVGTISYMLLVQFIFVG